MSAIPSRLRDAAFVARKDLAYLLRQRETILWTFLMPPLFFYFIGTVTGGGLGGDGSSGPPRLAVRAPADAGFLADALVARLEGEGFEVVRFGGEEGDSGPPFGAHARRLTVPDPEGPSTFTEAVLAGEGPIPLLFARDGESPSAAFDELRVKRAVYGLLADLAVLEVESGAERGPETATGEEPGEVGVAPAVDAAGFRRLREMPRALTVRAVPAGRREEAPSGFAQAIPGTLVMFTMLVLLTSGAILLVIERRQGLLRRLASTPITRGSVVAGKWASKMALGTVQIGFGMLVGTLLFGFDWGGALLGLAAVLLAWAAFNASLGIVLGNVARTEAQMAGIGVLLTMVLAALGGCWWPIEITPGWMQTLALALPTGWAMDGLHALVSFGRSATAVLPHVAALGAAALLLGWMGARVFRYE